MITKKQIVVLGVFIFLIYPLLAVSEEENKIIMMKPLTVEGDLDKPAIIIVPKAKLYEQDMFHKSFYRDIIEVINLKDFIPPDRKSTTKILEKEVSKTKPKTE